MATGHGAVRALSVAVLAAALAATAAGAFGASCSRGGVRGGSPLVSAPSASLDGMASAASSNDVVGAALSKIASLGESRATSASMDSELASMLAPSPVSSVASEADALAAVEYAAYQSKGYLSFTTYDDQASENDDGSWSVTGSASVLAGDGTFGGDVWYRATVMSDGSVPDLSMARSNSLSEFGAAMAVTKFAKSSEGYDMFAVSGYDASPLDGGGYHMTGTADAMRGDFSGTVSFSADVSAEGEVTNFSGDVSSATTRANARGIERYATGRLGYSSFSVGDTSASLRPDGGTLTTGTANASKDGSASSVRFVAVTDADGTVSDMTVADGK